MKSSLAILFALALTPTSPQARANSLIPAPNMELAPPKGCAANLQPRVSKLEDLIFAKPEKSMYQRWQLARQAQSPLARLYHALMHAADDPQIFANWLRENLYNGGRELRGDPVVFSSEKEESIKQESYHINVYASAESLAKAVADNALVIVRAGHKSFDGGVIHGEKFGGHMSSTRYLVLEGREFPGVLERLPELLHAIQDAPSLNITNMAPPWGELPGARERVDALEREMIDSGRVKAILWVLKDRTVMRRGPKAGFLKFQTQTLNERYNNAVDRAVEEQREAELFPLRAMAHTLTKMIWDGLHGAARAVARN